MRHIDDRAATGTKQLCFCLLGVMLPFGAAAQSPLDTNAQVPTVQYQSELDGYRVFDPDEEPQDWSQANRRVLELGGWRAYLRQANPSANARKDPSIGDLNRADKIPVVPAQTRSIQDKPSPRTAPVALIKPRPVRKKPIRLSIKPGECPRVVTATRIAFSGKDPDIPAQAQETLKALSKCFSKRRYIIGAHTDGIGSHDANRKLSEQRARAAVDYLISIGLSADQVQAVGYGETQPLDTNKTDQGRRRNNRLDFRLAR